MAGRRWRLRFRRRAAHSEFDWRISMATVATDEPFSIFPGIDRTLSILDGEDVACDRRSCSCAVDAGERALPLRRRHGVGDALKIGADHGSQRHDVAVVCGTGSDIVVDGEVTFGSASARCWCSAIAARSVSPGRMKGLRLVKATRCCCRMRQAFRSRWMARRSTTSSPWMPPDAATTDKPQLSTGQIRRKTILSLYSIK